MKKFNFLMSFILLAASVNAIAAPAALRLRACINVTNPKWINTKVLATAQGHPEKPGRRICMENEGVGDGKSWEIPITDTGINCSGPINDLKPFKAINTNTCRFDFSLFSVSYCLPENAVNGKCAWTGPSAVNSDIATVQLYDSWGSDYVKLHNAHSPYTRAGMQLCSNLSNCKGVSDRFTYGNNAIFLVVNNQPGILNS